MIHYLVTDSRSRTMRSFLETWGKALARRIKIVTYKSLLRGTVRLPERDGTYIFSDLAIASTLGAEVRAALGELHDRLVEMHGADRVHNDPVRSLLRYDLLRHLHQQGTNAFNAYRLTEPGVVPRFPALVRHELWSLFEQPALAHNPEQYEALLRGIKWQRSSLADFIAIEFCDTKDADGLYRKYGAFVVGDRIVPRHIFFGSNWHLREADLIDPVKNGEELLFLNTNPHAAALLECARLAGISYGRIDYGLLRGRPQIWEINTNASIARTRGAILPERRAMLSGFVKQYADAMEAIDREDVTSGA